MIILTCLKIFTARILDVSLGTIRTVLFVRGKTIEPFIIAFIEVLIWYLVAREALNTDANTYLIAVSYAGGYATGTYIGSLISKKFIRTIVGVQIIVKEKSDELVKDLRNKGYTLSIIELKNDYNGQNKEMLYIQVKSDKVKELTNTIKKYDKGAFIVVNDTKYVQNGFVK